MNEDMKTRAEDPTDAHDLRETVTSLPTHSKLVLMSVIYKTRKGGAMTTRDVHSTYADLCGCLRFVALPHIKVYDIISELEDLGLVRTRVVSVGKTLKKEVMLGDWEYRNSEEGRI